MQSVKFRAQAGDWLLNVGIFDQAILAIEKQVKIDRTHTIPYVAGYSYSGRIIYIDKRMPKGYTNGSRRIETDKYLILSEVIQAGLLLQFPTLPWLFTHQVALRIEQAAVVADNINWVEYNRFLDRWIMRIQEGHADDCPKDLDMRPYWGISDDSVLNKMKFRSN